MAQPTCYSEIKEAEKIICGKVASICRLIHQVFSLQHSEMNAVS